MAANAQRLLVKWQTPAEEALGIARAVRALVERDVARACDVCVAAPNVNWALQLQRALAQAGQQALVCIPPARLDDADRAALARLAVLADPHDQAALQAVREASVADGGINADELLGTYAAARGFTLMRASGMEGRPVFSAARGHVVGDEGAAALLALVRAQLTNPTLPQGSPAVPVMHYARMAGDFGYVFIAGCVDGLMPGPAAYEDPDETGRARALDQARAAFMRAYGAGGTRTVVSYFAKAQQELAQAARIRSVRTRVDGGVAYSVCRPTPLLTELGADRPTTTGGQAFLRAYGIN